MLLSELNFQPIDGSVGCPWWGADVRVGVRVFRATETCGGFPAGEYVFSVYGRYYPGGTHGVSRTADAITAQALLFHYLGNPEGNQGDVPTPQPTTNQGDYE